MHRDNISVRNHEQEESWTYFYISCRTKLSGPHTLLLFVTVWKFDARDRRKTKWQMCVWMVKHTRVDEWIIDFWEGSSSSSATWHLNEDLLIWLLTLQSVSTNLQCMIMTEGPLSTGNCKLMSVMKKKTCPCVYIIENPCPLSSFFCLLPDEGYYQSGRFQFEIDVPEAYNMVVSPFVCLLVCLLCQ